MLRSHHSAIPIVLCAVLIDVIGIGIVMPVLPELITQLGRIGMEDATRVAGWLFVIFAVGQFFAGPVLGNLGDRFGRRPVLICGMVAFAVDYFLMAAAPNLLWLFIGRAIAGIAGAIIGPAGAVIADVTPPEKRSATFGLISAAFGAGFVLGPALGGLVAEFGPRAPFIVAGLLAALNALVMMLLLPETLAPENRRPFRLREAHVIGAFRPLFRAGYATSLLVAWFLWQLGNVVYPTTWAFWAHIRFGWDARAIGLSLAFVGLMTILVQLLVTPYAMRRWGERLAGLIGLGSSAFTLLAYVFATQGWQVYAFFLIGGLGALAYPALSGILSRMVDARNQGALQGGIASMNSVSQIIGPLLAAQSLAYGTAHGFDGAAFLLAGLLMVIALLILIVAVPSSGAAATSLAADSLV